MANRSPTYWMGPDEDRLFAAVTFFAEQVEGADVSTYHYRVTFRPQTILPDIGLDVDGAELLRNRN